jgi:DNA-binding transcriptional regulator LsrR (DeoR family)
VDDRIDQLMGRMSLHMRERMELMSLVCHLFCQGKTADQIAKVIRKDPRYGNAFKREHAWRLVRYAAKEGWLRFTAPAEQQLAEVTAEKYDWRRSRITVVRTAVLDDVGRHAAERLLDLIRDHCLSHATDVVHVGFAGGRTLRKVAEHLAGLLREPAEGNPRKIVFHAMVAAFNEDDFEADPNNFISYFVHEDLSVKVASLPMPAPGIVETDRWLQLREFSAIRRVYEDAEKIDIIVTSAGRWGDEHSTMAAYLQQIGGSAEEALVKEDEELLEKSGAIGDLLWQPLSKEGPIDISTGKFHFRATTLMELRQLPGFIQKGGRVLLVLGSCSACHAPKGEILHAILQGEPRLVTDIVVDSPTVNDLLRIPSTTHQPK